MAAKNEVFKHFTKRDNNRFEEKQAIVALSVRLIKVNYALFTQYNLNMPPKLFYYINEILRKY
ncbi:hypothetical protein [Clostridium estertheticum]|uniref:Uncharacterized protein n=2 Tax=Clostridium estertheticum TaxID=238834 RepID=A0A7Y3STG7_9CLOT|nr:hypothetical protein [Clostridium estertheticum]MBU3187781.1 hypothetical protein [Clostridium estertheticum]MBW9173142.1 hypothetical protein [Clostridium estertheticum]NNU74377.1 hypothetical protein [Clostridium estertheticum]WBL49118.1 hypothetical protein LOR37_10820 [Clostridium estertheticum]WLC77212.1 hypothetical protein KTC99_10665 [Clostridium estertheticum]